MLLSHLILPPAGRAGASRAVGRGRRIGFTLIELMVVVGIVAILAAIAYPSYLAQITKTRRADAQSVLMQAAQYMERIYTENGCYDGLSCGAAVTVLPFTKSPVDGSEAYYDIQIVTADARTFNIRATPRATGPERTAGLLDIDETGRRGRDRNGDGDTLDAGEDSW
jgi:type IV pilus assembly protein PilE